MLRRHRYILAQLKWDSTNHCPPDHRVVIQVKVLQLWEVFQKRGGCGIAALRCIASRWHRVLPVSCRAGLIRRWHYRFNALRSVLSKLPTFDSTAYDFQRNCGFNLFGSPLMSFPAHSFVFFRIVWYALYCIKASRNSGAYSYVHLSVVVLVLSWLLWKTC